MTSPFGSEPKKRQTAHFRKVVFFAKQRLSFFRVQKWQLFLSLSSPLRCSPLRVLQLEVVKITGCFGALNSGRRRRRVSWSCTNFMFAPISHPHHGKNGNKGIAAFLDFSMLFFVTSKPKVSAKHLPKVASPMLERLSRRLTSDTFVCSRQIRVRAMKLHPKTR